MTPILVLSICVFLSSWTLAKLTYRLVFSKTGTGQLATTENAKVTDRTDPIEWLLMTIRKYHHAKDQKSAHRIWREIGWIDDQDDEKFLDIHLSDCKALVAELNGEAECLVSSVPGTIKHLQADISMAAITAVTTSRIARNQQLASRTTAALIAENAQAGLETSTLGMFEQGYYDRLGFGSGPYVHIWNIDPSGLSIKGKARVPIRLGQDDYAEIYHAMINRWRSHGGVILQSESALRADLGWTENAFGLGYRNKKAELTHFIWGEAKGEHGPYTLNFQAYQNKEQLLELMALVKGLGDQVHSVRLIEPAHLQLQDILDRPFHQMNISERSKYEVSNDSEAHWQIRINDVAACLAKTYLPGRKTLSFNLRLIDPLTRYLDSSVKESVWRGAGGDYTVHLGEECAATPGHSSSLPLLNAAVSGFSRLWMGCASAAALSVIDAIEATPELIDRLDQTLSLPLPKVSWEF